MAGSRDVGQAATDRFALLLRGRLGPAPLSTDGGAPSVFKPGAKMLGFCLPMLCYADKDVQVTGNKEEMKRG